MSLEAKRRWIVVLLCAFFAWPLVHRHIVDRYLVTPWRLFGWAMYCVPAYEPELKIYGASAEGFGELELPADDMRISLLRQQFIEDRSQLGRFVVPDLLAADLLARFPRLDSLLIVVAQPVYDPATARAHPVLDRYAYQRNPATAPRPNDALP